MNLFKTFQLTWWQAGFFKVGMLAIGIAIGATWHQLAAGYLVALVGVAIVSLATVSYVWAKQ